jgi:hypothetical protein
MPLPARSRSNSSSSSDQARPADGVDHRVYGDLAMARATAPIGERDSEAAGHVDHGRAILAPGSLQDDRDCLVKQPGARSPTPVT